MTFLSRIHIGFCLRINKLALVKIVKQQSRTLLVVYKGGDWHRSLKQSSYFFTPISFNASENSPRLL